MVKVKICGITNLEDALASADAGCDALGFVFYKKSPRYISPQEAKGIIQGLSRSIIKIGVFVNSKEKTIKRTAKLCNLDMLQFHGDESPEFCARFKGYKVIKAFRVQGRAHLVNTLDYKPFAYLFDTFSSSKYGGTGKEFDWRIVRHIDGLKRPVFLSGGLNSKNVRQAIREAKPAWVDVCTSVEDRPGKKDHKRVREFIRAAKRLR